MHLRHFLFHALVPGLITRPLFARAAVGRIVNQETLNSTKYVHRKHALVRTEKIVSTVSQSSSSAHLTKGEVRVSRHVIEAAQEPGDVLEEGEEEDEEENEPEAQAQSLGMRLMLVGASCIILVMLNVACVVDNSSPDCYAFPTTAELLASKHGAPGEVVTVEENVRVEVNGETPAQMAHAREIKARPDFDTTVDQVWPVDRALSTTDTYVKIISLLWLAPKTILFGPPLFVSVLPWFTVARIYTAYLSPTDAMQRSTCNHIIIVEFLGRLLLIFPWILMVICLFLDYFFYYLFSVPYCLCSSGRGWAAYQKSQLVIQPYRHGPGWYTSDFLVTCLCQCHSSGIYRCSRGFTGMCLFLPWMKYFINANPFIYALEERFVTQISTSLQDCELTDIVDCGRQLISRSIQTHDLRGEVADWYFFPHYPYPPPGRRWAMGMQQVEWFLLMNHVTHACAEVRGSTEQLVLSNSVACHTYRVMLWYDNPYHYFTGWVEANVSTGFPSQEDKKLGLEHPMWLVSNHSPLLSDRDSPIGVGHVDVLFDDWLPSLVDAIRGILRGQEIAKAMHQEVISKDGVSRPSKPNRSAQPSA